MSQETHYEPYQNFEYTAVRNEVPDSALVKYNAYANYDAGNYKEALTFFDQLVKSDKENIGDRFFRAMCLFERVEYEKALQNCQTFVNKVLEYHQYDQFENHQVYQFFRDLDIT